MERCFAVRRSDQEGRNDFNDFDDLLALVVDVTFDLGNLAFIHIDGGNNASFCLADISNLKRFGPINLTEGIGEVNEFNEISANCCRHDSLEALNTPYSLEARVVSYTLELAAGVNRIEGLEGGNRVDHNRLEEGVILQDKQDDLVECDQ
jgi:hypothetical protein